MNEPGEVMKVDIMEVKGCNSCVFFESVLGVCTHPTQTSARPVSNRLALPKIDLYEAWYTPEYKPDHCPLKKQSLLIKLNDP